MRSLSLLVVLLLTWLLTSCAGVGAAAGAYGRAAVTKGPLEYDFQGWRTRTISPTEDRTYVWGIDGIEAEGPTANLSALTQHTRGAGLTLAVGNELFGHDALGSVVKADEFFDKIGVGRETKTREVGNRRKSQ